MNDPVLEELRQFRNEHSRRFDCDLDAICDDYRKQRLPEGIRFVRLEPRKKEACCAIFPQCSNHEKSE